MILSIIIPVFNEEKTILQVLKKISIIKVDGFKKEVIIVDDGSSDKTQEKIIEFLKNEKNIKFIKHSKNMGKGAAVITGMKNSKGDYIVIQDADLEYDPIHISELAREVADGNPVVFGTRLKRFPNFKKEEKTFQFLTHYLGNRFLSIITSALYGQWVTDMETGYKMFPKKVLKRIKLNAKGFEFEPEITSKLLKSGYRIKEIPISVNPRGYDQGKKLNTIKDGTKALWYLLKYRLTD
jgi:glycosyltransferase involved in cell wall biosynthesis